MKQNLFHYFQIIDLWRHFGAKYSPIFTIFTKMNSFDKIDPIKDFLNHI